MSLGPMFIGIVVRQCGIAIGFSSAGVIALVGAMIVLGPRPSARVA